MICAAANLHLTGTTIQNIEAASTNDMINWLAVIERDLIGLTVLVDIV